MKKLSVFLSIVLAIIMVTVLFTSCDEQPGVYKPKKKISKVFEQEVGDDEDLVQVWEWDGNKVASITYYDDDDDDFDDNEGRDEFIYDGNRVIKIRDDEGYYADYLYADKKIDKIKYHNSSGDLLAEIQFQYDGDKVSVITILDYDDDYDKRLTKMIKRGFLGRLLPKSGMKVITNKMANSAKNDIIVVTLLHEGDNISQISAEGVTITFTDYDDHSNVLYNFFPFSPHDGMSFNLFSKNNPGKETIDLGLGKIVTTYTYTYNGDFPATIRAFVVYDDDDDDFDDDFLYTIRFEYK